MANRNTNEKQTRFTILVPVEIRACNVIQLSQLFQHLHNSGPSLCSTNGSYSIKTETLRLSDLRAAYKSALERGQS